MSATTQARPILKRWWISLALWLLIPLLMIWVLRNLSLADLWQALTRLSVLQIGGIAAANALAVLIFSGRWWTILRALDHQVSYLEAAGYRLAASGVSYFTPGPQFGGEPAQVLLLNRRNVVPTAEAAASVGLDRTLEVLVNFTFLAVGLALTVRGQMLGLQIGMGALAIIGAMLLIPFGLLTAVWAGYHPVSSLVARLPDPLRARLSFDRLHRAIQRSEETAGRFLREHPASVVAALAFSLASWAAMIAEYWLVAYLLGITLSPLQLISVLTAARIAFLAPLPGGIGTLEAGQVLTFQLLGLDPAAGLAVSLVIRARDVLFGGLGLWLVSLWLVDYSNKER
jgi:uncharacterized protein (TIRG00374 family)